MEALIALVVLLVVVAPLTGIVLSLTLRRRVRELELRLLLLESDRARASRAAESVHTGGPVPLPPDPLERVGARTPSPEPAGVGALIPPAPVAARPPQPVESETVQRPAQTGGFGGSGTGPPV